MSEENIKKLYDKAQKRFLKWNIIWDTKLFHLHFAPVLILPIVVLRLHFL